MITLADPDNVTATVTTPDPKTGGDDRCAETVTPANFMSRVLAWPGPNDPGYAGFLYLPPPKKGVPDAKRPMIGLPFRSLDDFMAQVEKAANNDRYYRECYFGLATQEKTRGGQRGQLFDRNFPLAVKAIWLDIDVKPGTPDHYQTKGEVIDALTKFILDSGFPPFTALVDSGGGFHVYWISHKSLTPDEWRRYASALHGLASKHRLKADLALTTDIKRILRMPGTWNNKQPAPRMCRLCHLAPTDLDFTVLDKFVADASPVTGTVTRVAHEVAPNPQLFSDATKPNWAPRAESDERYFKAGKNFPLVDPAAILAKAGCPHYRNEFATGGAGTEQPLWMQTILGTTFMENGRQLAHLLSNKYATYVKEDTDDLYDRKASQGLGWPSCETFERFGCKWCKTCPHKGEIKSPLNLANRISSNPLPSSTTPVGAIKGNWPGGEREKTPHKNILNTIEAIRRLGITCTWDEFRQKEYWSGHGDKAFDGEVSDAAVTVTRRNIRSKFKFYPGADETREAITRACRDNKSNPVLDYFDHLKWDGRPRLDKMLHRYLGAEDTSLNAAIGRKFMCAIVRRAKHPGCKFDHQLVLRCGQGIRKSMFCEDLAVFPDLFTDAGDLSADIKQQMETGNGKQIIEFPEHAGFSRAARDRNKASLSRKIDRARMAYAHYATDAPRQWVPIATVNPGGYLNDPTGERRYWDVAVQNYDREAFLADKDQLYAEAVAGEPRENLWLDTPELWKAHDAVVAEAKEPNELVDLLRGLRGEVWHVNGKDQERVSAQDIRGALGMANADAVRSHNIGRRIAEAMMELGWTKASGTIRCRKGEQATTGYIRPLPDRPPTPSLLQPTEQSAEGAGEPTESKAP
ncbi:MAG TPA: VapE domain-containing protein [Xanthobacteraceae bacterium]|nr:VapE domain-containing protein [Xanthobacteraceae bacterium]